MLCVLDSIRQFPPVILVHIVEYYGLMAYSQYNWGCEGAAIEDA